MEFLTFNAENPHSDGFMRKVLLILKSFIICRNLPLFQIKSLLKLLYPKFSSIISLRFQNDVCKILLFNSKDSQPLWYDVGQHFIHISSYLLNPSLYKLSENLFKEPQKIILEKNESSEDIKKQQEITADEELQNMVWLYTMDLIKEIMKVTESSLIGIDKQLAEEVLKKSQDLDINIMNFILKVLLPMSSTISKERQQQLVNLIDSGCTSIYSSLAYSPRTNIRFGNDSLSKFCISTLIELCSCESSDQEFMDVKRKIASLTTPVLINRCKAILVKYNLDENRSGQVPLPK